MREHYPSDAKLSNPPFHSKFINETYSVAVVPTSLETESKVNPSKEKPL
jgi:hypothetical protein